jgi:hypothetical protein
MTIVEKLLAMDKCDRRRMNPFGKRTARRKKCSEPRQKRIPLSRKEMIAYLRDNGIKSAPQLAKALAKNGDSGPTYYDFKKEFGLWENVRLEAWGDISVIGAAPMDDPAYQLRVILDYGLYSAPAYRAARSKMPHVVPSFKKLLTHWGKFSTATEAALRMTAKGQVTAFLRLRDQLGRMPDERDCTLAYIDYSSVVGVFGSISSLNKFVAINDKQKGANADGR